MSYSTDRIKWVSHQPLRIRFYPKLDGEPVESIDSPVLYLSSTGDVDLQERTQLTEGDGLTIDGEYIDAHVDAQYRDDNYWYRLDLDHSDGPRTYAAGHIDKVNV